MIFATTTKFVYLANLGRISSQIVASYSYETTTMTAVLFHAIFTWIIGRASSQLFLVPLEQDRILARLVHAQHGLDQTVAVLEQTQIAVLAARLVELTSRSYGGRH